jgi:glycosyltransferase involved in cell wall biosynthesis
VHIFFVTQWFPTTQQPFNGVFILEHARAVARIHRVSLLFIQGIDSTLQQPIQITAQSIQQGFMVYQLSYRHPMIPYTARIRQLNGARQVFNIASHDFGRPDIIHANINNTAAISVVLGHLAKIPVVISEHSSTYARKLLTPWQIRSLRFFMNRVNVIMPVCDALGQTMRGYGITRPMVTVQNVVDTDIFYPGSPGEQIISPYREIALIARLSEEKAVHLAIKALANLQQQGIYFYLHIAGDGPERAHLQDLVNDLGLSNWIRFHGYLPKMELAQILRRSSAFMLTSLWESQPVVILEALTCGLPVVAPAIGGIPEVVTPELGMLFQPGNVDDLTSKLSALLTNLSGYNPQSIHNCAIDHFSPDVVGNRLDHIYQQVIKNRHVFDNTPSF